MTRLSLKSLAFATLAASAGWSVPAMAHPHVFAEANLEVVLDEDRVVQALRHVWRFDDLFSSTVLFEFDMNRDLQLDNEELEMVGSVIHESLAEFDYFQFVTLKGRDVEMHPPERIMADFVDQQLIIAFESRPVEAFELTGEADFGVYDPTFYTAIDFLEDDNLKVTGMPDECSRQVVRPDPDEALAMNQESLTEAFFNEPGGPDYSMLLATRLEIECPATG